MGSSRLTSRRRNDHGKKWLRVSIAILATMGVIDTGSITLSRWGLIGPLSCPGGSEGCDKVLNSAWGTIFQGNGIDIPLSFLGFVSYLIILLIAIIPFFPGLGETIVTMLKKDWWILFTLSCCMSVFSLMLLGLMILKLL